MISIVNVTKQPTKQQVKEARLKVMLTQTEAAKLINKTLRAWQYWEAGQRKMDVALFELFLLKTKQTI